MNTATALADCSHFPFHSSVSDSRPLVTPATTHIRMSNSTANDASTQNTAVSFAETMFSHGTGTTDSCALALVAKSVLSATALNSLVLLLNHFMS